MGGYTVRQVAKLSGVSVRARYAARAAWLSEYLAAAMRTFAERQLA